MDKSPSSPVADAASAPPSPASLRSWEPLRSSPAAPFSLSKLLAGQIRRSGGDCRPVVCDLTSLAAVEHLASSVQQAFGRADILVNNAAVRGPVSLLHELAPEHWDEVFNTNVRGVFFAIRAFAPLMIAAGKGHIINISSLAAKNAVPNRAVYAASKSALNGLTYSVAEELRAHNIRVSVVCPGSTDTSSGRHPGKTPQRCSRPMTSPTSSPCWSRRPRRLSSARC